MTHDVFISYVSANKTVADAVCSTLEEQHIRCWYVPRDAAPDISTADAIIKAINESRVMVLIFSARSNGAQQATREVEAAVDRGIPIIPFRVEDAMPEGALALHLKGRHWLDALTPPLERHLETLSETVRSILIHRFDAGPAPAARIPRQTAKRAARRPYFYIIAIAAVLIVALIVASGATTDIVRFSPSGSENAAPGNGLKWRFKTGGIFESSPTVANGVVYIGSTDKTVYAVGARDGTLKWKFKTDGEIISSPTVINGAVYIGSYDNYLYALNAIDGSVKWKYKTGTDANFHTAVCTPQVANGVVYVGSTDHSVYAIGNQPTPTRITLTTPTTTPTIFQPITLTAKLYWWSSATNQWTPITAGKPVTIYHYLNGVRYNDKTINTDSSGKVTLTQSFGSAGQRTYYATFASDTWYKASTSSVLNVTVKAPIRVTLAASTATPAVNQKVTFTGKLYWWNSATNQWALITTGKPVTIYHYLNGVRYTDTTKTTNANGQITLTQNFGSLGKRTYYATFAGDTWYKGSTSAVVTIRVH